MTIFAAIFSKQAIFEKINYGMSKNPSFVVELPSFVVELPSFGGRQKKHITSFSPLLFVISAEGGNDEQ